MQLASRHCVLHWQSVWESTCTQPVNLPSHSAKLIHLKSRLINSSKRLRQLPKKNKKSTTFQPASSLLRLVPNQTGVAASWLINTTIFLASKQPLKRIAFACIPRKTSMVRRSKSNSILLYTIAGRLH